MSDRNHVRFSHTQPEYLPSDSENWGPWNIWCCTDDFDWFQERYHSGTPDVQVLRVREIAPSLWPNGSFPGKVTRERRGNKRAIEYGFFCLSEFSEFTQCAPKPCKTPQSAARLASSLIICLRKMTCAGKSPRSISRAVPFTSSPNLRSQASSEYLKVAAEPSRPVSISKRRKSSLIGKAAGAAWSPDPKLCRETQQEKPLCHANSGQTFSL